MKIAIIDADLIGRSKHRFPNLACMKISGYHLFLSDTVTLKTDYNGLGDYERVYVSRVFTDTPVPGEVLAKANVIYGGTGFHYDKAPCLPSEIEHCMPDYHLYDGWVAERLAAGYKKSEFQYYTDYSIGFLTRGCFRQCKFCVNQNSNRVEKHSALEEFVDPERPKICLLDDNFLDHPEWKEMLLALQATKKPFIFKQGLDARLLTDEKCRLLFGSRYAGDFGFAFDNVADYDLIREKLKLIRKHTDKVCKFFCFCGFDRNGKWDQDFWVQDIFDLFSRIELLMDYGCLPYIMRFNRYVESPWARLYTSIARWCNQPQFFKKKSLREFALANGENSACFKAITEFEKAYHVVGPFLDMKFGAGITTWVNGR